MILKPQIVVSGGYRGSNDPVCEVAPVTIATLPWRSHIDCSCSVGVQSGTRIMRACCRFDSLTIVELRCRTAVLKGRKGFRFSPSEAGPDAELLYLRFNQPLGRLHKALLHFTNADSQALLKPWCFCRQPASCGPILIRDKLSPSNPSARIRTRLPARRA